MKVFADDKLYLVRIESICRRQIMAESKRNYLAEKRYVGKSENERALKTIQSGFIWQA